MKRVKNNEIRFQLVFLKFFYNELLDCGLDCIFRNDNIVKLKFNKKIFVSKAVNVLLDKNVHEFSYHYDDYDDFYYIIIDIEKFVSSKYHDVCYYVNDECVCVKEEHPDEKYFD